MEALSQVPKAPELLFDTENKWTIEGTQACKEQSLQF